MRIRPFLKWTIVAAAAGLVLVAALPWLVSMAPISGLDSARSLATERSRFVTIPFDGTAGLEIHYLVGSQAGDRTRPSFLLLHGFTFNAFTWIEVLDFFSAQGRTIAYDQPPYGLSAKLTRTDWRGKSPYTREAAVEQLLAVMDALEMDRAILVGNSAGGSLALEAALAAPERVMGLVLLDPWVYVRRPTLPQSLADLPQVQRLTLMLARHLGQSDALLRRSYADSDRISPEQRRLAAIHAQVQGWDLAWGELLHRSLTSSITVSEHLAEIDQPTLVISGREDALVPLADSERLVAAMPNAELVVLPGCGHMPQEECPEQVVNVVADWLSRQTQLSTAAR
jgi:pimeloyl-ACP methyl ester carboxylesterase